MDREKFGKIYTGDYSQKGYDAGIDDRKANHPKNKLKILKILHPVNYLWRFDNAFESFSQNYDTGYADAQKVTHGIFNDTRLTGKTTMATDNYENHIRALENFRNSLLMLKHYTIIARDNYAKQIMAMETAGFVKNITQPLMDKYLLFSHKIDAINQLLDAHDHQLLTQKEALEQLIQIARMNP